MTENPPTTGLIYIFTGDGKGKTSAALGTAVRALSHGWSVSWIAFYKEASWGISEHSLSQNLSAEAQKRFEMALLGKGFYLQNPETIVENDQGKVKINSVHAQKIIDDDSPDTHKQAAHSALQLAQDILQRDSPPQVLVLDEVCNALHDKLISLSELKTVLQLRGNTHMVLTGRDAPKSLIEKADLVSEIKNIKHPYDKGQLAVPGLDF